MSTCNTTVHKGAPFSPRSNGLAFTAQHSFHKMQQEQAASSVGRQSTQDFTSRTLNRTNQLKSPCAESHEPIDGAIDIHIDLNDLKDTMPSAK